MRITRICMLPILSLLLSCTVYASSQGTDDKTIILSEKPIAANGTVLVYIKDIKQAVGGSLFWLNADKKLILFYKGKSLTLPMHDGTAFINGDKIELTQAPRLINSKSFVPLDLLAKFYGIDATWNQNSGTVSISWPETPAPPAPEKAGSSQPFLDLYLYKYVSKMAEDSYVIDYIYGDNILSREVDSYIAFLGESGYVNIGMYDHYIFFNGTDLICFTNYFDRSIVADYLYITVYKNIQPNALLMYGVTESKDSSAKV